MSDPISVTTLEGLKPFLNDKNILEIVLRDKKKHFKKFQKIILSELPKTEQKEAAEKAIKLLNKKLSVFEKNAATNLKNTKLLSNISKMQNIGLLMNGINLCTTAIGFAIMYEKLEEMSAEITGKIAQLQTTVKQGNDIYSTYELNKVLANHSNMLDCRKKQLPYSEDQMRELVDQEYNVLSMLISIFQKDLSVDNNNLIFSCFSLLEMFTASLRYFDELYFENNHEVINDPLVCHASHDKWMKVYDLMSSASFVEKLQDYATFEARVNTAEMEMYYMTMVDMILEQKQDVEDNLKLIHTFEDVSLLHSLQEENKREAENAVDEALAALKEELGDLECVDSCEKALRQAMGY